MSQRLPAHNALRYFDLNFSHKTSPGRSAALIYSSLLAAIHLARAAGGVSLYAHRPGGMCVLDLTLVLLVVLVPALSVATIVLPHANVQAVHLLLEEANTVSVG